MGGQHLTDSGEHPLPSSEQATPERIEKLQIGKDGYFSNPTAAILQADAAIALELVFFGQRMQRFQIRRSDRLLGFHFNRCMIADDEVDFKT